MPNASNSFWYDSSNDEYEIPIIWLGDMSDAPDAEDGQGLLTGYSSSYLFKGTKTGEFPTSGISSNLEIYNSLGRYGTFYPSTDTISSNKFFRVTEKAGYPGSYDFFAQADDEVASLSTNITGYSQFFLAIANIDGDDYLGIYAYGTGLEYDEHPAWIFAYNGYSDEAWNVLQGILETETPPGKKDFKPTKTRYTKFMKGIGGRGHGATHKGQTPAYETDDISNPGAPDETYASAIGSGFVHAYNIVQNSLDGLAKCLWGTTLGTAITNLFVNPLDFIISLNVFPCKPSMGSSVPIKIGKWQCTSADLGADASGLPLTKQFKVLNFGTVNVYENWGSFLDYTNTSVELYLPFIGTVDLDTAEVMNGSIDLDYTIDFFTGMCVANVNCNRMVEMPDGTVKNQKSQHSFQGNCSMSIPLSQVQYGNMIGSLIQAGTAGLKNPALGVGTLVSEAVGGGFKPSVTSKGTISANAGFCSVLFPYVRVTRPISAESDSFQEVMGYPSYIDSTLGECEDLCICESIDLHTITGATDSEIERIRQLCLEGVHV